MSRSDVLLQDARYLSGQSGGSIADNLMLGTPGSGSISDKLSALGLEPPPNLLTKNIGVPNLQRDSSFEANILANWSQSGPAVFTIEAGKGPTHGALVGKLTANGAGSPQLNPADAFKIPIIPAMWGRYVTAYADIKWDSVNAPNTTTRLNLYMLDQALATVVGGAKIGTPFTPSAGAWTRVQNNDNPILEGTYYINVRPIINNAVLNDSIIIDSMFVTIQDENILGGGPHPAYSVYKGE